MRRILLAICIQLSVLSLLAADITPQEALDIANAFIQKDKTAQVKIRKTSPGTRVTPSIAHKVPSRVAANKDNVYIINLGDNQGFVVVSGETGTTANILGYCDHGSFDIDNAPVQFLDLMNEYSAGIDNLRNVPSSVRSQMAAPLQANYPSYIGDIVVGPLLTTTWNQTGPYNGQCPSDENNNRCYTGCVPTAVAQVMNYWKWPKVSKDSIYGLRPDSTYGMIDFSGHTYDWDNMLDYYGWSSVTDSFISYNQTQADAVALLMADIGKAMRTMYCQENGSPTYFEYNALVRNFGYELGIEVVRGDRAADVKNALKAELDEKRPVLYSGYPAEGDGHALVCDGYTENNYFHFNYGWGGQTDGFYRLSAIPSYINNVVIWTNFRPYDAVEKVIDGIKYGLLPNGNADILEYVGGGVGVQNGVLVIPDSVTDAETGNTYAVTHICKESFFRKGIFTKMVMGNNIESIDRFSFVYTNIDTLVLSDKMEEVPEAAFQITNVKHLTIGANVKRIGALAFNTCPLNDIVCKSPRVELGKSCFTMAQPKHGDWEKCIVKIDNKAFNGARLNQNTYFENLEVLGDSAMTGVIWGNGVLDFTVGPKVREIAPSAFDGHGDGIYLPMLSVSADNPYFTTDDNEPILYNKDTTSVHLVLDRAQYINKTKVIKMEPGCVRGAMDDIVIPPSAVDMEGAFRDCKPPKYSATVTCHHMTPPAISDATFPDTLFSPDAGGMYLKVPEGTELLYAEAPGWRKFGYNMYAMDSAEFIPLPPQDLQYQMKIHGDSLQITAPIADVSSMRMTEENGEATVTLQVNGRVDLKTPVTHIDSIIFVPGFVYEGAEIFELNDSSTTVKAQECSINFESTTFSENAQVCLRNSVLLPRPTEGVTGGVGIDISMLNDSGRVHELSGVATITIPFPVPANQSVGAAYFNEQTGEWEPVYVEYDRDAGVATIVTDHLSYYALVSVAKDNTKGELMVPLEMAIPIVYAFDDAAQKLIYILTSNDPEMQQALQFKDEMSLWQAVGLDGFYNGVIAVTEPLFNFKPLAVDNAVNILGQIGTALTVLDVMRAELQGDKIGVASNTLKVIAAHAGSTAAAAIGTPIMAASLCMVAFVGIALEKFGTNVRDNKMNYFRAAYKYYYSMDGYNLLGGRSRFAWDKNGKLKPHGHYRTRQDWYEYFYPVFVKKNMDAERLMMYIKESVEDYCDQFWQDDEMRREILDEIERQGIFSPETYPDRELQKKISEDYFAELMNGDLVSVFTSLRKKQTVEAHKRTVAEVKKMATLMNKKVGFRITDSSVTEGQPSSFAGWTIGFPILDENVADAGKWRKTIGNDGRVDLGWFTMYALVRNLMPFKLTLFNTAGEAVKNFDFQLDGEADKKVIRIDLATQGVTVDNKHLDELHLKYTPDSVNFYFAGIDEDDKYQNPLNGAVVYMDEERGLYSNQVRWRAEVERFFNRHNFITVDSIGNFTIGEDIDGTFVGDSATGTFIIDTDYKFFLQTAPQYIDTWNDPQSTIFERLRILLNGSFKHQMACKYKVGRKRVGDHDEYDVTYTGEGFFDITARHINEFKKYLDYWLLVISDGDGVPPLYLNDIGIGTSSVGGDVTLEYKVTLK